MADSKKYEDYGFPLLRQGGWTRMGDDNDYVDYSPAANTLYYYRICTLDYVPQHHPNQITITGIASKELEVSVILLRSDNYIISSLGWSDNGYTFNLGSTYDKIGVMFRFKNGDRITPNDVTFDEVGTWYHSLRKLTTATEAVENPLYSDGTAITAYTIKGNTTQSGTPTPSNPVDVNGVGVRTENLFDGSYTDGYIGGDTGTRYSTSSTAKTAIVKCDPNTTYTIKKITSSNRFTIATSASYPQDSEIVNVLFNSPTEATATITTPADALYLLIYVSTSSEQATPNMMLNTGSTAKPYEPYGYKIPISSGGVTTNIYLGSTQSTRQIEKITFDGSDDEGWYLERINSYGIANFGLSNAIRSLRTGLNWLSNRFVPQSSLIAQTETEGILLNTRLACFIRIDSTTVSTPTAFKQWLSENPVDVWYVLATPQTAAVNEPLMKIGDYADTLSNAASIPTTEGANSITVDTTVQPSEFTATWTGWHDASVKEWDGSQWNE